MSCPLPIQTPSELDYCDECGGVMEDDEDVYQYPRGTFNMTYLLFEIIKQEQKQ